MPKKKEQLIATGEPAKETPMGQAMAVADSLDGEAIEENKKDKVRVKSPAGPLKIAKPTSIDAFKQDIRLWLHRYWAALNDNNLLFSQYLRIYHSLKTEIVDRELQYLDSFEPWQHFKNQVLSIAYDPSADIMKIKYCALYLKAIFEDICNHLDDPKVATTLSEPTEQFTKDDPIKEPRKDYELDSDIHGIF